MRGRNTPPTPLQRGVLKYYFLSNNELFMMHISPLERGLKGCVMVRGAVWVEVLRDTVSRSMLLLLGEEEHLSRFEEKWYLSASSDCFELSSCAQA